MKISINWLKDYVVIPLTAEELAQRLTMAGLEVEKIGAVGRDVVFELEITPNRPDCLNMIGIAREISAILQKPLKMPDVKTHSAKTKYPVQIENKTDCSRYIGTLIKDVSVDQADLFIKTRIEALGMRSINNIVDITNFCLMETGQPLHAFDADKLKGGKIVVRRAKAGEKIVTIDGVERKLDPAILVIADAERPVAVAGVMGGKETEVTSETKNILLESAQFDLGLIRKATRSLGLTSDSAYRFERGVPFQGVKTGADRAIDLILKAAGGKVVARQDAGTEKQGLTSVITVDQTDIEGLLGSKVALTKIKNILEKLECEVAVSKSGAVKVRPPKFRKDLKQKEDVIEEVGRIIGYDNLPVSLPNIPAVNIQLRDNIFATKTKVRTFMSGQGCNEIISYSMNSIDEITKSRTERLEMVKVFNPLSKDQEYLRPSLLPSFLNVLRANVNRGQKDLKIYELGKNYLGNAEQEVLAILVTGRRTHDWRASKKDLIDYYDLKGIAETLIQHFRLSVPHFDPSTLSFAAKDECATIKVAGSIIGWIGKVSSKVLAAWDLKLPGVYYGEIQLQPFFEAGRQTVRFEIPSEFPAVSRDVSLAVKRQISYKAIEEICRRESGGILKNIQFLEEYLGEKIEDGYRGLVFSLQYQSSTHTLREDEVNAVHNRICNALFVELDAKRR